MFDIEQIVIIKFRGRVTFDAQFQFVTGHSPTIIGDRNQRPAASGHNDVNPPGAGIDRVLNQLFDNTGRSFDDFASGDLIDYIFW
jgi:hypothetical protein